MNSAIGQYSFIVLSLLAIAAGSFALTDKSSALYWAGLSVRESSFIADASSCAPSCIEQGAAAWW